MPCRKTVSENEVISWKRDKHYDGIKPVNRRGNIQHRPELLLPKNPPSDKEDNSDICVISVMHVKILSMNICGLCEWKLSEDVLGTHLKKIDIILLQETWSAAGD